LTRTPQGGFAEGVTRRARPVAETPHARAVGWVSLRSTHPTTRENKPGSNSLKTGKITGNLLKFSLDTDQFPFSDVPVKQPFDRK
jgi:hypothetical protein